jgi:tetratricopeptide (TPR) repeat protein
LQHAVVADLVRSISASSAAGNHAALVRACAGWPAERLLPLLRSNSPEIVRAAVIALGVNGTMQNTADLVPLLAGPGDDSLVELVEDTLFSIWMRAGSPNANHLLADAVQFIHEDKFGEADLILRELVLIEPDFAEPHHQRGIVLTLQEHFDIASRAFESALKWNPYHFSAAANLGHALVQREDYVAAIRAYERALGIHPNMRDVAAAVESIEQLLHRA